MPGRTRDLSEEMVAMHNLSRMDDPYFIDADGCVFEASDRFEIRWGAGDPLLRQIET